MRLSHSKVHLLALGCGLTCFLVQVAAAQSSVYRCVDEDGSVIFSDSPCDDEHERHTIQESYSPDPNAPVIYSQPRRLPESRPSRPIDRPIAPEVPQSRLEPRQEPMATKCTSQDGGRTYYTLGSCGRSAILSDFGDAIYLQDTSEQVPYSEACSWAQRVANNTRNSSNRRRSARDFARSVCN